MHDNHWTFGNGAHILFPGGGAPVVAPQPHAFNSGEGCATVSDSNGDLLFYTDGQRLYDGANNEINSTPQPTLGGTSSSTHSAIVIPPAGTGTLYHIFAVGDWDGAGLNKGPISHTTVAASGGSVAIVNGPVQLAGPNPASERLAAVPHTMAGKYWLVSLSVAPANIFAMLIDGDGPPSLTLSPPYPYAAAQHFCVKFSPDGSLIAFASSAGTVDILHFDRATGAFSPHSQIVNCLINDLPYGVEFSPNGKYLYFTGFLDGYIRRHTIVTSPITTPFSATTLIGQFVPSGKTEDAYRSGALQLGPNGKIYGAKVSQNSLFEIGDPDHPTSVQFNMVATTTGGLPLVLNGLCRLGLPTFTRITPDSADRCHILAQATNSAFEDRVMQVKNRLATCSGEPAEDMSCAPVELPQLTPRISISWGDSQCDCVEGDDSEIMYLTVCNPYSNLTLSNVTIHQLQVVTDQGLPVPLLPDGDPSIQLTPLGPYCFDDIAPCACVTRQFVLHLRGTVPGPYRILVRGICFDACFHGDEEDCFTFDVCKD